MRDIREVILEIDSVSESDIRVWIDYGWVRPARGESDFAFSEVDVARISLIADLRQRMEINDEAVPVVLDLMDQIYGSAPRTCAGCSTSWTSSRSQQPGAGALARILERVYRVSQHRRGDPIFREKTPEAT